MASPLTKLLGWIFGPPPRLRCARTVWADGVRELERRTRGCRQESGAYLLGTDAPLGGQRILEFIYYDDIDPRALETGEVTIRQMALPKLWNSAAAAAMGWWPIFTCILAVVARVARTGLTRSCRGPATSR